MSDHPSALVDDPHDLVRQHERSIRPGVAEVADVAGAPSFGPPDGHTVVLIVDKGEVIDLYGDQWDFEWQGPASIPRSRVASIDYFEEFTSEGPYDDPFLQGVAVGMATAVLTPKVEGEDLWDELRRAGIFDDNDDRFGGDDERPQPDNQ